MIKFTLLTAVAIVLTAAPIHAEGEDCGGCKGKDKGKTEQKS
ncbi:MAG: hypothetical protein AAF558_01230 [Verrucomicrobiota bacterium]